MSEKDEIPFELRLRGLAFFFTCWVVAIHCSLVEYGKWFEGNSCGLSLLDAGVSFLFSDTLARVAVPFFFVVSGFWSVKHKDSGWGWWIGLLKRRAETLLIPYLLWNGIYLLLKIVTGGFPSCNYVFYLSQLVGWALDGNLACGPFWYIRCLLVYCLFLPLFCFLLSNRWIGGGVLLILAGAWIVGFHLYGCQTLGVLSILSFSIGIYWGIHKTHFRRIRTSLLLLQDQIAPWLLLLSIGAQLFCAGIHNPIYYWFERSTVLLGGISVFGGFGDRLVWAILPVRDFWGLAFFVYAVHVMFISCFSRLVPMGNSAILFIARWIFALGGCLVLAWAMRRWASRVYSVLTGGRVGL